MTPKLAVCPYSAVCSRERSEPAMSEANRVGGWTADERLVAAEHPPAAGRGSLPLSLSSGVDAA
nr:MAG: hypothetical protein DIU78_17350 [Pseudomonadota bacterium]